MVRCGISLDSLARYFRYEWKQPDQGAIASPAVVPSPAGRSGSVFCGHFLPRGAVMKDPPDAVQSLAKDGLGTWMSAGENNGGYLGPLGVGQRPEGRCRTNGRGWCGVGDAVRGLFDRIPDDTIGEMRVALGGGRLAVAEDLADDRQGDAAHEGVAGEAVTQVVEADVGDAGHDADALPGLVEAGEAAAGAAADDVAGAEVAGVLLDLAEQGHDLRGDGDGALAGLGIGEVEDGVLPVDHWPLEAEDLVLAQAGVREQVQGPGAHRLDVAAAGDAHAHALLEDGLQVVALLGGQEALDAAGAEALGVADRVAHVDQLPVADDAGVEAAEDAQDVVGGGRMVAQAGVERLDHAAGDLREGAVAEPGEDVCVEAVAIVRGRAGLEVDVDVLVAVAVGEFAEGRLFGLRRPCRRGVREVRASWGRGEDPGLGVGVDLVDGLGRPRRSFDRGSGSWRVAASRS